MAAKKKPNILVIWGENVGISNLSCYSLGLMGYRTPNIDRLAKEGMIFTDAYGEHSSVAGHSSFLTGQTLYRTGLPNVGRFGGFDGLQHDTVTIADLLKNHGYATAQFGKHLLGDLNMHLPTVHGFDEFFGHIPHIQIEEAPRMRSSDPDQEEAEFEEIVRSRGVTHSWATDNDDRTSEPQWGRIGKQRIENSGPLTQVRVKACAEAFVEAAKDFIQAHAGSERPFFVWLNAAHLNLVTDNKRASLGQAGRWQSPFHDSMLDHDNHVGGVLNLLDELRISDDTLVVYTSETGPRRNSWPGGGTTPFRLVKNTNWEGAFRVPLLVRWPKHIKAGSICNEIVQHQDWLPTLLAVAGESDVSQKLANGGYRANRKLFRNYIDGLNFVPFLTGKEENSPRRLVVYFSEDGDVLGLRYDNWKIVFMEQRSGETIEIWQEPFVRLRAPKLFNLRTDPFELADIASNSYFDWFSHHGYVLSAAWQLAERFARSFDEFPPVQKPRNFTINDALQKLAEATSGSRQ